jgi:hypothetical protein
LVNHPDYAVVPFDGSHSCPCQSKINPSNKNSLL